MIVVNFSAQTVLLKIDSRLFSVLEFCVLRQSGIDLAQSNTLDLF